MKSFRMTMVAALLAPLVAGPSRAADEWTAEKVLAEIAFAHELVAMGRGDVVGAKDYKSPESLVIAAGILNRANAALAGKFAALDVKPTDADGKALDARAEKSADLRDEAEALILEAQGMVAKGDAARASALKALIDREMKEPERGSLSGPKRVTRVLNPGQTHNYQFNFVGGQAAGVAMTSTGPPKIQFDVSHGKNSLFSLKGHNATYTWTPRRDGDGVRHFTVTLHNAGAKPTTYTLIKN